MRDARLDDVTVRYRDTSGTLNYVGADDPPRIITVWPCDHGGVRVEPGKVPQGHRCAVCGARPARYVLDGMQDGSNL